MNSMHLNIYKIAEKLKKLKYQYTLQLFYPGGKKIQKENEWDTNKVHNSVYVPATYIV